MIGSGATPSLRERLVLFLVPAVLLLLNLGGAPLFDVDEGAFSEATREMFERHDFLSTWLNGEPRFDKPIMIYWLQAIPVGLFGVSEWAFRLPSALAAALWCFVIGNFAWPRFGREAAQLATLVAATSLGVFVIGRAATADALLNLLLALALTDAWRHLESGNRSALRRMYLWIALGVLTKGPIALAIPGAVTLAYCASRRNFGAWLRAAFDPIGWLILIAVAAPWYAAALSIHGQAFIDGFIMKHNVGRFSGPMEGHGGSLFYYLIIVPVLLLPWMAVLFRAVGQARQDSHDPLRRFLWIWFGFVLVFFSLSGTKLPHYALYGCSPLFLLVALHRERLRTAALGTLPALLALAFYVGLPLLVDMLVAQGRVGDPYYAAQLARASQAAGIGYYAVTIGAFVVAMALVMLWRVPPWRRLSAIAALQGVVLAAVVAPYVGDLLQGPVKRAALVAKARPEPGVQWNFFQPSFAVYREQQAPVRAPKSGEIALTREDRIPADAQIDILYSEGGVRLVRQR
ncbi:glycosyltransferase family 39 protein [Niveibacterium umoris]|uniref:4-amino-4-deoxy-L-arabinose transferase-like glycosyltransferase n=1 Tax=Niveibacterium umoris TaxID=1193620 RepID=A0A840BF72_9RHOO|nr:glycosyltransferase family 39 protein [Niveibacterium umoris]MBB4011815.1 4-amino-4-deoxy-L-arabinose transferase-like glycosyltransferase [Niveibacterium umoris]